LSSGSPRSPRNTDSPLLDAISVLSPRERTLRIVAESAVHRHDVATAQLQARLHGLVAPYHATAPAHFCGTMQAELDAVNGQIEGLTPLTRTRQSAWVQPSFLEDDV
jgi:hypothetical protein